MEKPKFIYVSHMSTTPDRLWAALTKPEFTAQYYGGRRIQSDWTPGASIKFLRPDGGVDLVGEVLQIEPEKLLSCTFTGQPDDGGPPGKPSRVTFEISAVPGITTLTITHTDFEPGSRLIHQVGFGWTAIACAIKTLLETGKPLPFNWER
jgi:uncharacterized protein YndB with AHSA1/START domain